LVAKAPSTVQLITSIEWSPFQPPAEITEGFSSSRTLEIRPQGSKKRGFYDEQDKKALEGLLKSRGIQYKKRMNKGQLRSLLEKDDVEHPDAAKEDGDMHE
jgi:hypothetical protein